MADAANPCGPPSASLSRGSAQAAQTKPCAVEPAGAKNGCWATAGRTVLAPRLSMLRTLRLGSAASSRVNSGPLLRLWQKESSLHDSLLPPLGHSGRIMNKQISPFSNITGVSLPPESDYRFKHALIQDAAYENLLKSRRQILHRRVGEALRDNFAATAAAEPELLAHHFTQAGLTEAAIEWWGKAGQQSLERSALVEAVEQLTRALDQIATLPSSPVQRREEIRCQVALANALMHTKGYAAPETRKALDQARALIEKANALGEPPE